MNWISSGSSSSDTAKDFIEPPRRKSWNRPVVERKTSALRRRSNASTRSNPSRSRKTTRHAKFQDDHKSEERDEFHSGLEKQLSSRLPFRERMRHFTWTWFTMTMATGGIANVLYVAHEFFSAFESYLMSWLQIFDTRGAALPASLRPRMHFLHTEHRAFHL